jgi:hypothetical protein
MWLYHARSDVRLAMREDVNHKKILHPHYSHKDFDNYFVKTVAKRPFDLFCLRISVTRLAKFLPIVWLFLFWQFCENYRRSPIFSNFFHGKSYVLALTDWATLWAIFSQTHLVTLSEFFRPREKVGSQ